MYHIWRFSLICSIIYKILNRNGKIIIKLDSGFKNQSSTFEKSIKKVPKIALYSFLKIIDYLLIEDMRVLNILKQIGPKYINKLLLTTNGAYKINSFIGKIDKENIISLCGRFGTEQKNNELLLNMLEHNNISILKGWKIYLIGSYTYEFEEKLNKLFNKKKLLKKIIIQTGFLNSKKDLYKILSKSKIFLHTASWEGDPNIQYDSMFCGCFMINTNIANIKQNYPKKYCYFYNIKDEIGLYKSLKKGVSISNTINYNSIQKYCIKNFTWDKSLKNILNKF